MPREKQNLRGKKRVSDDPARDAPGVRRNMAVMSVGRELLKEILLLPDEVRIHDIFYDITSDTLKLRLTGREFPVAPLGQMLEPVVAEYRRMGEDYVAEFTGFRGTISGAVCYKR